MFSPFLKYFKKQWLEKEGPKNISVFKRSTRTTSSVEAYNLNLSNKIKGKGHFFKFIQCIIDAEYEKSHEFALLFQNGGIDNPAPLKQLRDRSHKIMDAMDLFDKGEIDIQFLKRIVSLNDRFSKEDLFDSVDTASNLSGMVSKLKTSISSLSSNESTKGQADSSMVQTNPCNVCLINPKSVMLRPCKHLNISSDCWAQILAHNPDNENTKPKCPTCQQIVNEAICNVFIYT